MTSSFEPRRRRLIGAVGVCGMFAAMPALAGAHRQAAPKKIKAEPAVSPAEDLMREHGVLARLLLIYEAAIRRVGQGEDFDPAVLTQAAETMRDFGHDYHEKLEEEQVFPRFKKAGVMVELVDVLLAQHVAGRRLTERILKAAPASSGNKDERKAMVEAMQASITLYRPHVSREDTDIFPTLRSLVTSSIYDEMAEAFEKEETAKFGAGFEKIAKRVEQIEKRIGIHDLAQFTPKT